MKIQTSKLTGAALDWAVAKCEGVDIDKYFDAWVPDPDEPHFNKQFRPSTDWSQGGPIIERENIGVQPIYQGYVVAHWSAVKELGESRRNGPTPLIATMRCYVASKLGEEIEVPEELV